MKTSILAPVKNARDRAERAIAYEVANRPQRAERVFSRLPSPKVIGNALLREIVEVAHERYTDGAQPDPVALQRQLEHNGNGAGAHFDEIMVACAAFDRPDTSQLESAIDLLVELGNLQRADTAWSLATDWSEKVAAARTVLDIDAGCYHEPKRYGDLVGELLDEQEQINAGKKRIGLTTGLPTLDAKLSLVPGVHIPAGQSKTAKTHFQTYLLDHGLRQAPIVPGAMFALEMPEKRIARRFLALRTGIDAAAIVGREPLPEKEFARLREHHAELTLEDPPLHLEYCGGITISDLCARIRRWAYRARDKAEHALCCVDFLQLIAKEGRAASDAEHLQQCAYALASLAGELGIVIVAAAQLNREGDRAGESARQVKDYDKWRTPYGVHHIQGSGGLLQAAESVVLTDLIRRRDPDHRAQEDVRAADLLLVLAEQRSGLGGGAIRCKIDLTTSRIWEAEDPFPF